MRAAAVILTAFGALLIAARPVPTESELGSRVNKAAAATIPTIGFSKEETGRLVIAQFAQCTFGRHARSVSEDLSLGFEESQASLGKHVPDECLNDGSFQASSGLYRGYLFGELYRRHEFKGYANWPYAIVPLDLSVAIAADTPATTKVDRFMLEVTDCLYKADAESVRTIILSETASTAQKKAYAKLIPQLGPCIPQGNTLELSRATLESAFGEYLYRSLPPGPAGKSS